MPDMLPYQRHLFDIPENMAYLNCATMSPLSKTALAAGQTGLARKAQPWTIPTPDFFKDTDSLRPKLARLINADTNGIAFVPSVSYGMATAAKNIKIEAGQNIVTMADQFPSNVYVWRDMAARSGAALNMVSNEGTNMSLSDAVLEAIGPDTRLVACAQIRWTDGAKLDLEAIGAKCREVGAAFVLDLTQSCGAMAFDVAKIQPDFVVCAAYKWMLGPYATGFMYIAPAHRAGTPLEHGWITREGARDFSQLTNYTDTYEPGAQRFDMGERSNFALLPAFEAGIDQLLDWGVENIEHTLGMRNLALAEELAAIGAPCPPASERGPHYLCALWPDTGPSNVIEQLSAQNICISQRGPFLRITPHLYNSQDDQSRLIEALKRILSQGS